MFLYSNENISKEHYFYQLIKYLRIFSVNIEKFNKFKFKVQVETC